MVLEDVRQAPAVSRVQAFDANGNPVNAFPDGAGGLSPFLDLPNGPHYLALAVAGNADLTDIFILYYEGDGDLPENYNFDVYKAGADVQANKDLILGTPRGD